MELIRRENGFNPDSFEETHEKTIVSDFDLPADDYKRDGGMGGNGMNHAVTVKNEVICEHR